ncbi:hypothetical protein LLG39_13675 [bacterium]|nr:hypothetical protein [bacterium]
MQEVVVREKNRVSLVLTTIPEVHGSKFAITEEMGAAEEYITNYPPLRMTDVVVKKTKPLG